MQEGGGPECQAGSEAVCQPVRPSRDVPERAVPRYPHVPGGSVPLLG